MTNVRYPSLYQINTRVWLTERAHALGRPATLDDIPDADLDRPADMGFDWVWFLSVWQTGQAGQQVSRSNPEWRREFQETLPDLRDEDIAGSGFAISSYTVHEKLGGNAALSRLRDRLRERGLRLTLDFVPNHTGLDHTWVQDHPEYYVHGTELDLARAPRNYTWAKRTHGQWRLLDCKPAWEGNWTWDCFLAFAWQGTDGDRLLVAVNYAPNQSQYYVPFPFGDLADQAWRIEDVFSNATFERDGNDLRSRGLYLDMPAWGYSVFSLQPQQSPQLVTLR
jgi:glycosidase